MAVTQLHGILYANQNMQVVASKQISLQGRVDFQNIVAAATANEKQKEIDETRATEDSKGIEADREHNQGRANQEMGSSDEKNSKHEKKSDRSDKQDKIPYETTHILDIKV